MDHPAYTQRNKHIIIYSYRRRVGFFTYYITLLCVPICGKRFFPIRFDFILEAYKSLNKEYSIYMPFKRRFSNLSYVNEFRSDHASPSPTHTYTHSLRHTQVKKKNWKRYYLLR